MKEGKPKVTRLINELITEAYFEHGRTLSEITLAITERSGELYYSNQVSGIVLVMVREGKLSRLMDLSESIYVYTEGSICPK